MDVANSIPDFQELSSCVWVSFSGRWVTCMLHPHLVLNPRVSQKGRMSVDPNSTLNSLITFVGLL